MTHGEIKNCIDKELSEDEISVLICFALLRMFIEPYENGNVLKTKEDNNYEAV